MAIEKGNYDILAEAGQVRHIAFATEGDFRLVVYVARYHSSEEKPFFVELHKRGHKRGAGYISAGGEIGFDGLEDLEDAAKQSPYEWANAPSEILERLTTEVREKIGILKDPRTYFHKNHEN